MGRIDEQPELELEQIANELRIAVVRASTMQGLDTWAALCLRPIS